MIQESRQHLFLIDDLNDGAWRARLQFALEKQSSIDFPFSKRRLRSPSSLTLNQVLNDRSPAVVMILVSIRPPAASRPDHVLGLVQLQKGPLISLPISSNDFPSTCSQERSDWRYSVRPHSSPITSRMALHRALPQPVSSFLVPFHYHSAIVFALEMANGYKNLSEYSPSPSNLSVSMPLCSRPSAFLGTLPRLGNERIKKISAP
jgi:hypothetical protein